MEKKRVIFSISSSFSGSTLLSFLLNAHPQIVSISETDPLGLIGRDPDFMCSCGKPIRSCDFFRGVREGMEKRGVPFSVEHMDLMLTLSVSPFWNEFLTGRLPYLQSTGAEGLRDAIVDLVPAVRRKKEAVYRRNEAFVDTLFEMTGASVYVDANKDPYRMRFFQKRFSVGAIYLFKNGIAGVHSYMKRRSKTRELEFESICHRWFKEQLTICRSLSCLPPEEVVQLPYSELCSDVHGTLAKLFRMIGVRDEAVLHPDQVPHHIVGNAMRLRPIAEIVDKQTWQTDMTAAEIAVYRRIYDRYIGRIRRVNPFLADHIWH